MILSKTELSYRDDILASHQRIKAFIHETPVLSCASINDLAEADLFFKCENFQKTGSFKVRGAVNALMQLGKEQRANGVVTHSSGNFAQALSLAARNAQIEAFIVMPENAPSIKKKAVINYGGKVFESASTVAAREAKAQEIIAERGAIFIHSSNDIHVILGQATATKEFLERVQADHIITPVGGGGLAAGTGLSAHYFGNKCTTIGAEPMEADDAFRSLKEGKIAYNKTANTIADGLRTQLGEINFPIIQKHLERIILVTEKEILDAMQLIWERMKIVVEPSAATTLAAVLKEKETFRGKKIGCILSGGNVDITRFDWQIENPKLL